MSLEIEKKVSGKNHPNIAGTYCNIGTTLYEKEDYQGSLDHFNQALGIN